MNVFSRYRIASVFALLAVSGATFAQEAVNEEAVFDDAPPSLADNLPPDLSAATSELSEMAADGPDHLHQAVLIARHIRHRTAIINLGHTQPISIGMLGALNHPDDSRPVILSFKVDHFFDTAKLLIDPRH